MLRVSMLQRSIRFKQRPYTLLLFTAILLFVGGLLRKNITIDIHLHDSYFIFSMQFLIWFAALILLAFWLLYLGTYYMLYSKRLAWVHIILSVATAFFIFGLPYFFSSINSLSQFVTKEYTDYGNFNRPTLFGYTTNSLVNAFVVLLLIQLLFFVNFFMGFWKRMRRVGGGYRK